MQDENERQWKKVNGNTYDISSIKRVTKKWGSSYVPAPLVAGARDEPRSVFHSLAAQTREIFFNIRRDISNLQAVM